MGGAQEVFRGFDALVGVDCGQHSWPRFGPGSSTVVRFKTSVGERRGRVLAHHFRRLVRRTNGKVGGESLAGT